MQIDVNLTTTQITIVLIFSIPMLLVLAYGVDSNRHRIEKLERHLTKFAADSLKAGETSPPESVKVEKELPE